jgi:hypothetical protein
MDFLAIYAEANILTMISSFRNGTFRNHRGNPIIPSYPYRRHTTHCSLLQTPLRIHGNASHRMNPVRSLSRNTPTGQYPHLSAGVMYSATSCNVRPDQRIRHRYCWTRRRADVIRQQQTAAVEIARFVDTAGSSREQVSPGGLTAQS